MDRERIQRFADRHGVEVHVVGSRARDAARPDSDYDYVLGATGGNNKLRKLAERALPRGTSGGMVSASGGDKGIDVIRRPFDATEPHLTFTPSGPRKST